MTNMIDCIYECEQRENLKASVCSGNHSLSFVISSLSLSSMPPFLLSRWRKTFLGMINVDHIYRAESLWHKEKGSYSVQLSILELYLYIIRLD